MHVPAILVDLRSRSLQRLADLAGQLLDQADDALFNLAQRSNGGSEQQDHLDSMRNLRKQRAELVRGFSAGVADGLALPPGEAGARPADPEMPGDGLSLIAIDDLEEQLAQERLAIAVSRRHAEPLLRFGAAFARIWEREAVEEEDIPLGPLRLARVLSQAVQPAELPVASRLVVLKLLERLLIAEYGDLLGDLNQFLHQRGIAEAAAPLPALRRSAPGIRRGAPRRAASDHEAAADETDAWPDSEDEVSGESGAQQSAAADAWFAAMAEMFAHYLGTPGAAGVEGMGDQGNPSPTAAGARRGFSFPPPGPAAPASLERAQVLAVLRGFQQNLPRSLLRAAVQRGVALGEQLKVDLLVEAQRGGESARRLDPADEQALTLVGMLFDVLFDQSQFSDQMRGLLARLLPAYAQIALHDPQLFAQRSHPARRLLNALTEAADGNEGGSSAERDALLRITAVVERIVREYRGDIGLLVDLEERFAKVVEQRKHRAALAERRTAESQRGRERLDEARTTASLEIAALTAGQHPPAPIDEFLRRDWGHHLTVVLLRAGEDSADYARARRIGVELWKAVEASRRGEVIPDSLRDGLRAVDASTGRHRSEEVLAALAALGPSGSRPQPAPPGTPPTPPRAAPAKPPAPPARPPAQPAPASGSDGSDAPAKASSTTPAAPPAPQPRIRTAAKATDEGGANPPSPQRPPAPEEVGFQVIEKVGAKPELPTGDIELSIDPTQVQPGDIAKVRALKQGCWVDLVDAQGETQAAKLSWISPISQRMLFVNRSGARLCLLSPPECAALITQHKLIPRAAEEAFDRAMVGLLERLRSERGAEANQPAPSR
ncbi:DUF1631 family protein [Pseudomarimonas salicorniae]|uniref:DUF1631 domain-containing protein n=1 Tax=Pseudomarimonas salicorniae TaxID=2933270 RepID=A0ABT0GH59_9GAMM|nr:DUF1631 family protein [Lysobacter sp. CAU 1642]MCK7593875.1 DUF1631 domain-containing protein [Lysobacter sp. CAU 1642]